MSTEAGRAELYRRYEFILECPMYRCDIEGIRLDPERLIAPVGARFLLIEQKKDTCIIRFLVQSKKHRKKRLDFRDEDIEYYKYFRITRAQLDYKALPMQAQRWSFALGSVLAPIKLRWSPFDFSKDFTIGSTFGLRYRKSDFAPLSISALLGIGISSISLDSFSTRGKLRTRQESLAFTPSLGVMLEFGNAQIGLFTGMDMLSGGQAQADAYIYQQKPWLSIGLGYTLFSTSGAKR